MEVPAADERRATLLATKLAALVRDHWPLVASDPFVFPAGAGRREQSDARVWVLVDAKTSQRNPLDGTESTGPKLPRGWAGAALLAVGRTGEVAAPGAGAARGQGAGEAGGELHVLSDHLGPIDVARLSGFNIEIHGWRSIGRALVEVLPESPAPPVTTHSLVGEWGSAVKQLRAAGCEVVIDGGIRAEILGLEVARVVEDHDDPELPVVEVGVGKHDRLAAQMLRPGDPWSALEDAIAMVRRYRRPDAPSHPANQLALEGWLRAVVLANPGRFGLSTVPGTYFPIAGVTPPVLKHAAPAFLATADTTVLVMCTTGRDIDAVPDLMALAPLDASLVVLALEAPPFLHRLVELAAATGRSVELRVVPKDWASEVTSPG